jgi:hypothetical protein
MIGIINQPPARTISNIQRFSRRLMIAYSSTKPSNNDALRDQEILKIINKINGFGCVSKQIDG